MNLGLSFLNKMKDEYNQPKKKYQDEVSLDANVVQKRPSLQALIHRHLYSIFGGLKLEIDERRKMGHPKDHL